MNQQKATTLPLSQDWCPACGAIIECVTTVMGANKVSPGDYCICASCAEVFQFGPDLKVVRLPVAVLENLGVDDRRMMDKLVGMIQQRNRTSRGPSQRGEA